MITKRLNYGFSRTSFKIAVVLSAILCLQIFMPLLTQAQIPRYINYQGKLTDTNDDPVTGDIRVTVRIYDAESGGTALWTETHSVTVTMGIFSVLLGNSTALSSLDFNVPYWYSLEIGSDGEMTPRQRLTSVGYAINADKLDGYEASQFLKGDTDNAIDGNLAISGAITGGANEDIVLDPVGTGNILMKIDSTSGDFKITDGSTNWVLVDNATGNVTISNDLTVNGTIHGNLASTEENGTFTTITVTGASDLRGNISNSGGSGAVTVADALTQTGSSNQVSFAGNVDAGNGVDVTGALTVSGASTLNGGLDMNSNITLDYSGASSALNVTQASTGPSAQFSGGRVIVGANELTNANALSSGELYVLGDLEVDGTIYGNISSGGSASLGDSTLSSLTVSGASNLQGNVDAGSGIDITGAVNFAGGTTYKIDSSGAATLNKIDISGTALTSGGTDDYAVNIAQILNDSGASGGSDIYRGIKLNITETNKTGWDNVYLMDLQVGGTSKFYVNDSGNAVFSGTVSGATPTLESHLATKAYVDSVSSSGNGWTDGGTGVYLTASGDNVGIGTSSTDTYKLNVSGSTNTTSFYIGGAQVTSDSNELNKLDGYTGTASNLNTLTNASNADALHTHTSTGITSGIVLTSPSTAQTIQPTADAVPLTIKGSAGASSNVFSIYNAGATPSEKIFVDSAGHMRIAETTTGSAQASSATLYFGRNATDNWESIGYDPTLGTKGLFTFSAPLQVEASSPTGITFVEKNSEGVITKSQGFMYDPSADEFSFTGGKMKQAFQNLVRGGSFESWNTPGWYSAWYSGAFTTATYAKYGTKSLCINDTSNTQTAFKAYYISNWDRLKGSSVTLSVWAKCDSGTSTASIGIGTNSSSAEATVVNNINLTTTWQNFTYTYSVPAEATSLKVYLYAAAGSGGVPISSTVSSSPVYYDGVTLAEGKLALEYGPSPVFDTGDQVIGGSLAIGADIDPYNTAYGMNYYKYPRIIFGEPDTNFGGYYDAYSSGGYYYNTYGGGAGEISFRPLNTSSGTFTFNRPIGMDSYGMSTSSWRSPALFIGRLYDYSGGSAVDKPDYAWTTKDAYIKGVVEADGGLYGDVMSFYGGVGKTSNLLTYSEDFTQSAWSKSPSGLQITSGELAPDGTLTACKITSSVDASVTQTVSAANSTEYTFSVYLAPGTQSYAYIFLKSNVEADWWTWPNYQYVDLYNTTGWRRFSVTYTTPSSGTTSVTAKVMFYGSASYNSIKVWGAQLRPSASQGIYIKTTSSSVTNSNSLFHGDGSGLTNLPASSIVSGTAAITGISGNVFTVNEDLAGAPSENLSIVFNRGNVTDSTIVWDETNDKFVINNSVNISSGNLTVTGAITADSLSVTGTVDGIDLSSDGWVTTQKILNGTIINEDIANDAAISDTKLASITTAGKVSDTALSANVAHLNAAETVSADWVNTGFPWADNEVADNLTISAGTINNTVIGAVTPAAGTFSTLTSSGSVSFPDNSISMSDINWNAGKIFITPEYPNASIYGDGTGNNGTLSLRNTEDANWKNYYEWTSQSAILQDYIITDRFVLPVDFSEWAESDAIKVGFITQTADTGDNKVDVIVYKSGSATPAYSSLGNTALSWQDVSITYADLSGNVTWAAGDVAIIKIIVYSKNGNYSRIGDITLNYTR